MSEIERIEKLLDDNKLSITAPGCFTLPRSVLLRSIEFCDPDCLSEYIGLTHLSWVIDDPYSDLSEDEVSLAINHYNGAGSWSGYKFWDMSQDSFVRRMESQKRRLSYAESYEGRRVAANIHISNKTVRKSVFNRDGNKCKKCGTTKRLSVDHIIPVIQGGGNEEENLQTLCRSCNSSKGGRI